MSTTKKRIIRLALCILALPFVLFAVVAILIYIPPIQNYAVQTAVQMASESTGMDISIGRISLKFPIDLVVHRTAVVNEGDTILNAERLTVEIQMSPLFEKRVEIDGIELKNASVNTLGLIEGMTVRGDIGNLFLESHGVELDPELAIVNDATLKDTKLYICMADTSAADTTESEPLYWKIQIDRVSIENVEVSVDMPLDTMDFGVSVGRARLTGGYVDLHKSAYSADQLLLENGGATFNSGILPRAEKGLDPSHIAISDMFVNVDSIYYCGEDINALITDFSLKEISGLQVKSTAGHLVSNSQAISLPQLRLTTNSSEIEISASVDWAAADMQKEGALAASLMAKIGKEDMMLLLGDQDEEFRENYPTSPLQVNLGVDGNLGQLRLTTFSLNLPTALSAEAKGEISMPLDSLQRNGTFTLSVESGNTDFLSSLTGGTLIPEGLVLNSEAKIEGQSFSADLKLYQNEVDNDSSLFTLNSSLPKVTVSASYDMSADAYAAEASINSLNIHDFMPEDSLFTVTAYLKAEGEGLDFFSPDTKLTAEARLDTLQYADLCFTGVSLDADLHRGRAKANLNVKDKAIDLAAKLSARLRSSTSNVGDSLVVARNVNADFTATVGGVDLKQFGVTAAPLKIAQQLSLHAESDLDMSHSLKADMTDIRFISEKQDFKAKDIHAGLDMRQDSIRCFANAGDLVFLFRTLEGLDGLTEKATLLMDEMSEQWSNKHIDQPKVKQMLPHAQFRMFCKSDNPLANLLQGQAGVRFEKMDIDLKTDNVEGLTGNANIYKLRTDSLELDSIYFKAFQDSARTNFVAGVKAPASNKQEAFDISLRGFIGANEARTVIQHLNQEGECGALIGFRAGLEKKGISLHVFPDEPTLVYRKFRTNKDNYLFLSDEGRIKARMMIYDENRTGMSIYSHNDSTVQQDLSLSINRIEFEEFKRIIPYMPDIAGTLSMEAHYVQDKDIPTVAGEVTINRLKYNEEPLGNWEMSMVYLPQDNGDHFVDGYVMQNNKEIVLMKGAYIPAADEDASDGVKGIMALQKFPLNIVNPFVPDKMAMLQGTADGILKVEGSLDNPLMNGELAMDSVSLSVPMASLLLKMDDRKLKITDNKLVIDKFNIYTEGANPFTIDGEVDMSADMANPLINLRMNAENFELINAKKSKDAMIYGKLYVDFNSMITGSLEDMKMRGNMNVLGTSDITYLMENSPLVVEDRLGETVTFVNFADTASIMRSEAAPLTLGGMDVMLTIHIDEAVQARVDLNASGSDYMAIEGGGDLSFQYKADGSMTLTGRYTLSEGEMKYEMPVIPLKTFSIKQGSYVEWTGDIFNPSMNILAYERMRAAVSEEGSNSRTVNFDVGVSLTNTLEDLGFTFTLEAPDDGTVQNELAAMSAEDKNKLAVTMLVTGIYMSDSNASAGFDTNTMLNSFLQGQINNIAGSALKTIDLSIGMESTEQEDGSSSTDYNFQFAKRLWNNRVRIVIGGSISTGNNVQQDDSFIDNISLEYRLDSSGTRYVKIFHEKNYESILDGEVTETGAGIVLRKKVSKMGDLFIFKKKKKSTTTENKADDETTTL